MSIPTAIGVDIGGLFCCIYGLSGERMEGFVDYEAAARAVFSLKDHPGLLAIFIILIVFLVSAVVIIIAIKNPSLFARKWLRRSSDKDADTAENKDAPERKHGVKEDRVALMDLVNSINDTLTSVVDKQKKTMKMACIPNIYSSGAHIDYKMEAAVEYIKLHGNGHVKYYLLTLFVTKPGSWEAWLSALHRDTQIHGPSNDKFFIETTAWIEREYHKQQLIR